MHPTAWNQHRSYGPLVTARYDSWPPPAQQWPGEGVGYFRTTIAACVAEVYQDGRAVNPRLGGRYLTGFIPSRELRLLDLTGPWPIRVGASHAINSGPKDRTRRWANALHAAFPDADGVLYIGVAGIACVALWLPPAEVFPGYPSLSRPLADPSLRPHLADACAQIAFKLR